MIRQPGRGQRNINDHFYGYEKKMIELLNEVLGEVELTKAEERTLIWLAGWEESTVKNLISAFSKAQNLDKEKALRKLKEGNRQTR